MGHINAIYFTLSWQLLKQTRAGFSAGFYTLTKLNRNVLISELYSVLGSFTVVCLLEETVRIV